MDRLSEELKHCLDGDGCVGCKNFEQKSVLTCRNLLQAAYEKIKECETLEEQGKLLKLPVAVGDTAYRIEECGEITELEVLYITFFGDEIQLTCKELKKYGEVHHYRPGFSIGRKVFYTKEEAEAALKEMSE